MHALIENGAVKQYPYGLGQLKAANPLTSFPAQENDEMLASFGVQRVFFSTPPELTDTQVLEEGTPVMADNRWNQVWIVRDMTADEMASRTDAKATSVRTERTEKLRDCDWTQLDDTPMSNTQKADWAEYRQALRDVPEQAGFPWEVEWPVQPE